MGHYRRGRANMAKLTAGVCGKRGAESVDRIEKWETTGVDAAEKNNGCG